MSTSVCVSPVTEDNVSSPSQLTERKCSAIGPPGHLRLLLDHQKMAPFCLVEQLFPFLHGSFFNVDGISLPEDILIPLLNLYFS